MLQLPIQFEQHLKVKHGVSGKTLRNYRADLLHFKNWAKGNLLDKGILIETLDDSVPYLSSEDLVLTYKQYHMLIGVPASTTNRRLSTLRNFGRFLEIEGITSINPAKTVTNVKSEPSRAELAQSLISDFANHLTDTGVSKVTAKNYLSDVRHFLAWMEKENDGLGSNLN